MNRFISHHMPCMAALTVLAAGVLASCGDADSPDANGLPQGKYPIELNAAGISVSASPTRASSTRATVDNDWEGVSKVAVQIGNSVKEYIVSSLSDDKNTATLTSADPFYWVSTTEEKSITAWHPYSESYPGEWKVKADQSDVADYQASDLIRGESTLSFADRENKIGFTHQTAKVTVTLIADDGVTLGGNTSVRLVNISGIDDGTTITPYRPKEDELSFHALVTPQTIAADQDFIRITADDKIYVYRPEAAKELNAGEAGNYTITVKAGTIEVTEVTTAGGTWTGSDNENVEDVTVIYKPEDLKIGDYYYSDGTVSDGGLRKLHLKDNSLEWEEPRPVALEEGRTCIGIVFHAGRQENDESDYTKPRYEGDTHLLADGIVHGYVVALSDADATSTIKWGRGSIGCKPNNNDYNSDWNGYLWTTKIIVRADGYSNLSATNSNGFPATYYAVKYTPDAPTASSGWFFPAFGQLVSIYNNRNYLFNEKESFDKNHWSSTESGNAEAYILTNYGTISQKSKSFPSDKYQVRPILVF